MGEKNSSISRCIENSFYEDIIVSEYTALKIQESREALDEWIGQKERETYTAGYLSGYKKGHEEGFTKGFTLKEVLKEKE